MLPYSVLSVQTFNYITIKTTNLSMCLDRDIEYLTLPRTFVHKIYV